MREALRTIREWFEANRPGETFDCWFVVGEREILRSWSTRYDLRVSYAGRKFSVACEVLARDEADMIDFPGYLAAMLRNATHKMIRGLESTPAGDRVEGGSVPTR